MPASTLQRLADDTLLTRTAALVRAQRHGTAELLAHLAEIEHRGLHLAQGCSSLFAYCTERLGMSEDEAYVRIRVARAARRFPRVAEALAQGEVHLSGLCRLAAHLTPQNHDELLAAARGRSKRELEELLAARFPRPDAPEVLRKLPAPRGGAVAAMPAAAVAGEVGDAATDAAGGAASRQGTLLSASAPDDGALAARAPQPAPRAVDRPRVEPVAAERFRVQLTASRALHDKIRAAQDLLRHEFPDGDLAAVCERAFDVLLGTLRQRKFALLPDNARPRRRQRSGQRTRHIPAEVKRAVLARDGARCAFVDAQGRRCSATGRLEYHHVGPYGRGGAHTADNIQLVCAAHNRHLAVQAYGAARIARAVARAPGPLPAEPSAGLPDGAWAVVHKRTGLGA